MDILKKLTKMRDNFYGISESLKGVILTKEDARNFLKDVNLNKSNETRFIAWMIYLDLLPLNELENIVKKYDKIGRKYDEILRKIL